MTRIFHVLATVLVLCFPALAEDAPAPAEAAPGAATVETLDLATAQRRALADNPGLQAAEARVAQARQRVRQAQSLYFPLIQASYSASHTEYPDAVVDAARRGALEGALGQSISQSVGQALRGTPLTAGSVGSSVGQGLYSGLRGRDAVDTSEENYRASLSLSYLIFDGFERRFTVAAAKANAREFEANQREAQRLLLDAVAQAYYGVQLAREEIRIADADESFNKRLLREAEARRRVGTGALSDVLNFEVRVRAAQAQRISAERNAEVATIALATLMGLPEARLPDGMVVGGLVEIADADRAAPDAETLVTAALEQRPDLAQQRHALDRAEAVVQQRRAPFYPSLGAVASRDAQTTDNGRLDRDDFSSTVGLNLSYDLFSGGRRVAALREARHAQTETEQLLADAEIQARSEVQQALEDLSAAIAQLNLQEETTGFVQRNRDLVEKEYQAGQGALARLNQAQRDLVEAEGRLALARVTLRRNWHAVRTATGETLGLLAPVADTP
jgi:outer membrane protein TolC